MWWSGHRIDNFGFYPDPVGPYAKPDSNFTDIAPGTPLTVPPGGTGTVTGARRQPWGDQAWSITIKMDSPENSVATHYALNYVSSPQVHVGQHVGEGDILALAGNPYGIGTAFAFTDANLYGEATSASPFQGRFIDPRLNPVPFLDSIAGKSGGGEISLKQYINQLFQDLGQHGSINTSGIIVLPTPAVLDFLVGWAHVEGGGQTNACRWNILNTMQEEPGSSQCPGTLPGIQIYPDDKTGITAQVDALTSGRYGALVHALTTNDEQNLGLKPHDGSNVPVMAGNVAGDLTMWVSGKRSPLAQSYILSILESAGISGASIQGGTASGSNGASRAERDRWANASLGVDTSGVTVGGTTTQVNALIAGVQSFFGNPIRLIKIGVGSVLLIAGSALAVRSLIR